MKRLHDDALGLGLCKPEIRLGQPKPSGFRPCLAELLLVEKGVYQKSCLKVACAYVLFLVHFEKQLN
jgi:hypothetical protein